MTANRWPECPAWHDHPRMGLHQEPGEHIRPIDIGIPADEPCTPEDCAHSCWLEPEGWTRDVSIHWTDIGDVDGEGPCLCEHHDEEGTR